MTLRNLLATAGLGLSVFTAPCGGETAQAAAETASAATREVAAADVPATGNVIEVKMITDGQGNYFQPAEVSARPGDVVRFVLESGVHNVSFPADQNASAAGLPAAGEMLQLPGQTYDVPVNFGPGEYKFQCDPHAMLGMVGTLKVQ